MKKIVFTLCCLMSLTISAQTFTASEQKDIAHRLQVAKKLRQNKQHLQAMDSATYALSLYEGAYELKKYVRDHWTEAMDEAQDRLDTLLDNNSIVQCRERVQVYRYLVDINDNLRTITLPLYGRNNSWVWQPDIQYWAGHLDREERLLQVLEAQELERLKREEEERLRAEQADDRPTPIQSPVTDKENTEEEE